MKHSIELKTASIFTEKLAFKNQLSPIVNDQLNKHNQETNT